MATKVFFNNKLRKLPGAYSTITSGEQNTPQELDYGKVIIIDNGLGAGFGGGAGSIGTYAKGKDAVYKFTNIDDFKSFIKGGLLWKISEALFFPFNNQPGVSTLYFAKAATTVPAQMTFEVERPADSGTARVTLAGGLSKTVTFSSDLSTTTGNFITANAPAYALKDITLTNSVADLIFEAATAGVPFVSPAIANLTGALKGVVVHTQVNVVAQKQKEIITLTGTSGTANVTLAGGLTKLVTFAAGGTMDLTQTAADFVTSHAPAYDGQGIIVTSLGAIIIFEAKVAGTGFTQPVITNATGNLAGTVEHEDDNVVALKQKDTITLSANEVVGIFAVNCKDEGVIGNGALTATHLDKGYAFTIVSGVKDPTAYILKIWLGQWKGDFVADSIAFDEVAKALTTPILVAQSPEFTNLQTLIDWASSDSNFGKLFILDDSSIEGGAGTIVAGDVSAYATYSVATGGTESYGATELTKIFEAISDLDYQFMLSDETTPGDFDTTPTTSEIAHINDPDTEFIKTLVIAAFPDEDGFDDSVAMAETLNSNRVIAVHGSVKMTSKAVASGFRTWPAIFHAAMVLGRICGLPPQVPVTNKQISVDGVTHNVTKKSQETALDAGLVVTIADQFRGGLKVLQGVNTLQDNENLFNNLGQSVSIQFERITSQFNRELIINSEIDLLGQNNGVNVNTLSPKLLKSWTENYLLSRTATTDVDNLLLSFRNVTVTRVEDYYKVNYGIVVNNEITKIFYTGFLFRS